jgi:K+-transporting ATPase ATPase A chain
VPPAFCIYRDQLISFAKEVIGMHRGSYGQREACLRTRRSCSYSSGTGNNSSAFAITNTPWYNLTIGLAMLIGRFLIIIPMLAIAGSLAMKRTVAATSGTLPTHGPLFVGLLAGTVIIVGALTYFPALSLTPIVEHFLMNSGRLF